MFGEIGVYRRTVHRVTARRISAIRPINEPIFQIEFEINRFRQTIEQKFDVGAVRRRLTIRDVDLRTEEATFARVIGTFLRPIDFSPVRMDGNTDAPFHLISPRTRVAFAGVDQSFDLRTIKVRAHHAHSFAVAPVKLAALFLEMELLRRKCRAFGNNNYTVLTIEISALD